LQNTPYLHVTLIFLEVLKWSFTGKLLEVIAEVGLVVIAAGITKFLQIYLILLMTKLNRPMKTADPEIIFGTNAYFFFKPATQMPG
jgi:hypothetical protein